MHPLHPPRRRCRHPCPCCHPHHRRPNPPIRLGQKGMHPLSPPRRRCRRPYPCCHPHHRRPNPSTRLGRRGKHPLSPPRRRCRHPCPHCLRFHRHPSPPTRLGQRGMHPYHPKSHLRHYPHQRNPLCRHHRCPCHPFAGWLCLHPPWISPGRIYVPPPAGWRLSLCLVWWHSPGGLPTASSVP